MVRVVLDGGVVDVEAEAGEEVVEVVAVFVVLGLGEDDEAAAGVDIALDGVELGVGEDGGAAVGGGLPLRVGGVGDDEDVGIAELGGEGAGGVVEDLEVAGGEGGGGRGERGVAGVGGLHPGASSGRMVHASEWNSSKTTRASFGCSGIGAPSVGRGSVWSALPVDVRVRRAQSRAVRERSAQ